MIKRPKNTCSEEQSGSEEQVQTYKRPEPHTKALKNINKQNTKCPIKIFTC